MEKNDGGMSNIVKFPKKRDDIIATLKCLLLLAEEGAIIGLCGYAVSDDNRVISVTTDVIDNACVAYCSILLSRMVADDSDDEERD